MSLTKVKKMRLGLLVLALLLAGGLLFWGINSGQIIPQATTNPGVFVTPGTGIFNLFVGSAPITEIKANEKVSYRFTAQEDLNGPFNVGINTWKTRLQNGLYSYQLKVKICKNGTNNQPDLNQCSSPVIIVSQELSCKWKQVGLAPTWPITKNNIYHLVTEFGSSSGSQYIKGGVCYGGTPGIWPRGRPVVARNNNDSMLTTLKYAGSWSNTNRAPLFMIQDSTGQRAGQPYSGPYGGSVGADAFIGEKVKNDLSTGIGTIGLRIQKNGTPADNLHVEIRDIGNSYVKIAKATILQSNIPSSTPGENNYVYASLSPAPAFPSNKFLIIISSPKSAYGSYTVYGTQIRTYTALVEPYLSYLKGETYGGVNSTAVYGTIFADGSIYGVTDNEITDIDFVLQ